MHDIHGPDMEQWFAQLRAEMADEHLRSLFDTYAAEALFGRLLIAEDLQRLPQGSSILEIGAGALLLSSQLKREGFNVTALEPTGIGFSHFERMREIVLASAVEGGFAPLLWPFPAEQLQSSGAFSYAFSINVMEHVDDIRATLEKVVESLKPGATYRFTCPNYLFPYEPHFNLPIVLSKKLTQRFLGKWIFSSTRVSDPAGTWRSLNWINVPLVSKIASRSGCMKAKFDRRRLGLIFERILKDPQFAGRRSPLVCAIITWIVRLHLHKLLQFVPASLQPIIDCKIIKWHNEKIQS